MPLFQTAVLNKYLKQQDSARMATAYAAFRAHFHDAAVQANILRGTHAMAPAPIGQGVPKLASGNDSSTSLSNSLPPMDMALETLLHSTPDLQCKRTCPDPISHATRDFVPAAFLVDLCWSSCHR
jgi:hypothetical protein